MPTPEEQDLLALLERQRAANAQPRRDDLPNLPADIFLNQQDMNRLSPQDRQDIEGTLQARIRASDQIQPGTVYVQGQPQFVGRMPVRQDIPIAPREVATVQAVHRPRVEQERRVMAGLAEQGELPDISNLFMNRDAEAQAELTGQVPDGGIPVEEYQGSWESNELDVQFENDFDTEIAAGVSPYPTRFRADRSPPPETFSRRVTGGMDGRVVMSRGLDGRFMPAEQARAESVGNVRQDRETSIRAASAAMERMARQASVGQMRTAPAPPMARQASQIPIRRVDRPGPTAHDIIRSGGLDIGDD